MTAPPCAHRTSAGVRGEHRFRGRTASSPTRKPLAPSETTVTTTEKLMGGGGLPAGWSRTATSQLNQICTLLTTVNLSTVRCWWIA